MDEFKPYVPLIQALRNPGMKDRHFEYLSAQTGIQMALKPTITFKSLLILGVMEFEELIKTVSETAAKEYATERTLNKMIEEWEAIVMEILPYKTTGKYVFLTNNRIIVRNNKEKNLEKFNIENLSPGQILWQFSKFLPNEQ